jgi:hypothetical protein
MPSTKTSLLLPLLLTVMLAVAATVPTEVEVFTMVLPFSPTPEVAAVIVTVLPEIVAV